MDHHFSLFCRCSPAGYAALRDRIDACARTGHACEYRSCQLPRGCTPDRSTLGFRRQGDSYLLYLRPAPRYVGHDLSLTHFFSRSCWLFPCFSDLTDALSHLASDGGPAHYEALLSAFQSRIAGQQDALQAAAFKLSAHLAKQNPQRPLSLFLYGPTGVGKSEFARSVAPVLNQFTPTAPWHTVWTELNTFPEAHSVSRLIGAPPGYAGYGDPPVLETVRRFPRTVFVFDELDKAHPALLTVFMSILDEGRIHTRQEDDAGARILDFRRCIFLFTGNTDLSSAHSIGFSSAPSSAVPPSAPSASRLSLAHRLFLQDEAARQALIRHGVLREIAGRFQGFLPFAPLSAADRQAVTVHQIKALAAEHGLCVTTVSDSLAAALTPADTLSVRSSAPLLEALLTPLFSACGARRPSGLPLLLTGSPELPVLRPDA